MSECVRIDSSGVGLPPLLAVWCGWFDIGNKLLLLTG